MKRTPSNAFAYKLLRFGSQRIQEYWGCELRR